MINRKLITPETREKMRISHLGKSSGMKGKVAWNKGIPHSPEHCLKISLALKGKTKKREHALKVGAYHRGANCAFWKGGIYSTTEGAKVAKKASDRKWRINNPEKSNFTTLRRLARLKGAEGSHTLEEWEILKDLYQHICLCCKRQEPYIKLTEDHIIPITMGGSDYIDNVQPLCNKCNARKNARFIDYRPERKELQIH